MAAPDLRHNAIISLSGDLSPPLTTDESRTLTGGSQTPAEDAQVQSGVLEERLVGDKRMALAELIAGLQDYVDSCKHDLPRPLPARRRRRRRRHTKAPRARERPVLSGGSTATLVTSRDDQTIVTLAAICKLFILCLAIAFITVGLCPALNPL
ncbi:hypothetical protein SAMD00023353_1301140 [Rosellinia necatrix]|uniref:Uncharacterized protein n=1 Tax=Rosellinia necatrix TaxID=77044 RepID=A0A1W2TCE2_ROSNE|nr:hypothetical protein SAMD00023353_1301140 [Rosellinia necatrix]